MAKWGNFRFGELEKLAKAFQEASDESVIERFIQESILEIAFRANRRIKKRTPVNNGELRRAWSVGKVMRQGNAYVVEIINNLSYASYVEYGFRAHWIPGYWEGHTFVYDPNEKSGMYVGKKDGWVEGKFMMTVSMKEIEKRLPTYIERKQMQLLEQIMNGRTPKKG